MTGTQGPVDSQITLYGADWCGDCRRAKAWFEANGHDYHYVDLVVDPDETERVLERNGGVKKIPVIVFADDSHLVEPTNDELRAKMNEMTSHAAGAVTTDAAEDPAPTATAQVIENTEAGRFELHHDGQVVSFASYDTSPTSGDADASENVVVPHVETAPQHQGNGYAGQLMDGVLGLLRESSRTITPLCPFAASHIRNNPEHHDLVAS